ncbi:MAG: hypothetical protein OEU93_11515 [Rubrivivax sp.]|nr:hypothetical protein [Rubrivivax sp.]
MDVYLIIGNPGTRKASIIRSLTGCFNRSLRDIQLQGVRNPLRFYARVGTIQEKNTTIEEFVAEVRRTRCEAVICCLAPEASPTDPERCPDAKAYVSGFKAVGWRIKAVAVLGQNGGGLRAANLRQYPLAPVAPINATAREIRAQFGWL